MESSENYRDWLPTRGVAVPPAKKSTRSTKRTTKKKSAPTKKTAKRTTKKRATKKRTVTKRSGPRKMSAAHKKALADGRAASAVVDRYLSALHVPKQRGRKVSPESLRQRLADAQERARKATGLAKLHAAQDVRDLKAKIAAVGNATTTDVTKLEADFVKVAKTFGDRRGIGYGAWRDAGVPAPVLKKAKVARTRG
jgi:hypothetical protein